MKSKGSKGWVVIRQKALRVVLIHVVASCKLLVGRGWHHTVLHHAVLLHAACRGSQFLPDVEREVVGGEERNGPLYREVGLRQRDHPVLLNPLLIISVRLSQAFLVLQVVLNWFWLYDARQLVDIGNIGNILHPWEASLMLTRLLLLLLLRCLRKMSVIKILPIEIFSSLVT